MGLDTRRRRRPVSFQFHGNASLTFSPACFRLPFACSSFPLRSRVAFPTLRPAASFALPLSCCDLFLILSLFDMCLPLIAGQVAEPARTAKIVMSMTADVRCRPLAGAHLFVHL